MSFPDLKKMSIAEKFLRDDIKEYYARDPCNKCGTRRDLTLHHKDQSLARVYDKENIQVLCRKCHNEVHNK